MALKISKEVLDIFTESKAGAPKNQMKEGVLLKGVCATRGRHLISQSLFWESAALTIFTIGTPQFFQNCPAHQAVNQNYQHEIETL